MPNEMEKRALDGENKTLSVSAADSALSKGSTEADPRNEQYHTTESESERHMRFMDLKFQGLEWQLHSVALENLNTLTNEIGPAPISPGEATEFTWKLRKEMEQNFRESLNNPEEQVIRERTREPMIQQLRSLYDGLDQKLFNSPDEKVRLQEWQRALTAQGLRGKNTEVQGVLDSLYHPYLQEDGSFRDGDHFVADALVQFDPLIFKKAQQRVLGRTRDMDYESAFKAKLEELKQKRGATKTLNEKRNKEASIKDFLEGLHRYRENKKGQ